MMDRILVAVDDSPAALAAAEMAIEIARTRSAALHFVIVTEPGLDADAIVRYVNGPAVDAGLDPTVTTSDDTDYPFEVFLATAREWHADIIIMGQSGQRGPSQPYVGSQTEHLLEFSNIPVLVVPDPQQQIPED